MRLHVPAHPHPTPCGWGRKELRGEVHGRVEDAIIAIADATMQSGDVNLERFWLQTEIFKSLPLTMVSHGFNIGLTLV